MDTQVGETLNSLQKNIEELNHISPHLFCKGTLQRLERLADELNFYIDATKATQDNYDYDYDYDYDMEDYRDYDEEEFDDNEQESNAT